MVRVTIIHDWVMTFMMVHDRFTANGPLYLSLMYRITKWTCNEKNSAKPLKNCTIWSSDQNCCSSAVSAFAYANSRHKNYIIVGSYYTQNHQWDFYISHNGLHKWTQILSHQWFLYNILSWDVIYPWWCLIKLISFNGILISHIMNYSSKCT